MSHIEHVREGGSEGLELVIWLVARRAMADVALRSAAEIRVSLFSCAGVQRKPRSRRWKQKFSRG